MVRVYYSEARRAFIGKYEVEAGTKNKAIPVDIQDEHSARQWFEAWLDEYRKGNPLPVPRLRQTLRTLLPRWQAWQREVKADQRRIDDVTRVLRLHCFDDPFADVDVDQELTIGACTDWIERVQRKGLAPLTVRNIVQGVRTFLSDCRGKGWVQLRENYFNDRFVKAKTANAERVAGNETIIHLTAEQAKRLVECDSANVPDVRKATNVLAVCTGLRAGELQALSWGDVHLTVKYPYVDVQRQLVRPGLPGEATFKPPKKKSYRQVPLHPLAALVISWWAVRWVSWVGREAAPQDPVFANRRGEFCPHAGARAFREDLVQAGVPAKFEGHNQTFHALRRTFLTMLTDAGVQDSRVSALAGHGAKTVTARHYIGKHLAEFYPLVVALPLPRRVKWVK